MHIGRARAIDLAVEMRAVVPAAGGEPLIAVGTPGGRRTAVLAFALGDSDLPLQVAYPLLMSNLVDFVAPAGGGVLPPSAALGEPIGLELEPSVESVTLVDDGVESEIRVVAGRGTLPGADRVGVRELRAADGTPLGSVAANLFDAAESAIAPGDPARFSELGRIARSGEVPRQPSRNEWWWPLALLALILLAVEWLIFHRPSRRAVDRWLRRAGDGARRFSAWRPVRLSPRSGR